MRVSWQSCLLLLSCSIVVLALVAANPALALADKASPQMAQGDLNATVPAPSSRSNHDSNLDTQGGPDAFGYRYVDNQSPDTVVYEWVELCGDTLARTLPASPWGQWMQLGLGFPYYGSIYDSANVSIHGTITFGQPFGSYFNDCNDQSLSSIFAFWDGEAILSGSGGCNGDGTEPWIRYRNFGNYAVIEWKRVRLETVSGLATYEVFLFTNGDVKIVFHSTEHTCNSSSATVGIEAFGPTYGLQYSCNSAGIVGGRAIRFVSPAQQVTIHDFSVPWIISPVSGTVAGGSVLSVSAHVVNLATTTESSPIKYSFAGGAAVSETTGVLAHYDTETHSFAATFTVPTTGGNYALKVWTDLAGDENRSNDTSSATLYVKPDECDNAAPMVLVPNGSASQSGNTTGSTASCSYQCANHWSTGPDHFFYFTATECRRLAIALAGNLTDPFLVVYDGQANCCGTALYCNDDHGTFSPLPSWDVAWQHPLNAGDSYVAADFPSGTYYIRVGYFGSSAGPYTLTIYDNGPCSLQGRCCYGNPLSPSCEDLTVTECQALNGSWSSSLTCATDPCVPCADFGLTAPGTVSGNTTGAGDNCNLRAGEDQIVAVTIPTAGEWTFTLCNSDPAWDSYIYLTTACCSGTVISEDDDSCGTVGGLSKIACQQLDPGTYFLDIEPYSNFPGHSGAWRLDVTRCQCLDPDSLTATLGPDNQHLWLHFRAPEIGLYVIYESIVKNNDGDPRDGDPHFSARETITTTAPNTVVSWTDTTALVPYKNYTVLCIECWPAAR